MIALAAGPSVPLAFLAGLVSFLSPCVFPLIPAYAAYLGGRAGGPALATVDGPVLEENAVRVPVIANGIAFVAGFGLGWSGGLVSDRFFDVSIHGINKKPWMQTVVDRIITVESNGDQKAKNKRSSAMGPGQFLDQTWLDLIRTHRPRKAATDWPKHCSGTTWPGPFHSSPVCWGFQRRQPARTWSTSSRRPFAGAFRT